ncbi:XdhC family protein [Algiphilus sp.]|uniref:XdhC family protein n=1 Tax=Algiphilus sp. TaxID=1872431 RepID=UPI0025BC044E|nr:XdhC family protein [Algiphilus sp.]MCK5771570.1 XdhC family protein [Algiphilus sp.]
MPDSATSGDPPALTDWPDWPEYGLVDDLLPVLERWSAAGRRFALATLVEIAGASPRPLGAEMAIDERGECAGYVSGGCVEAEVAREALGVLADGEPRLLDYGAGSPALDIQLTCGGRIGILVRTLDDAAGHVAARRAARDARRVHSERLTWDIGGRAGVFDQHYPPPTRLVVAGGDPVTLALARMGTAQGFDVVLLRPRGPERPPAGIPLAGYDRRPVETALAGLALDPWCAVYTLTHDIDIDHAVLLHALRSPAFCVGALGSRSKAAVRVERLRADGIDEARLSRLHTPAGLPIGGRSPQQIALSIVAQVAAEGEAAHAVPATPA